MIAHHNYQRTNTDSATDWDWWPASWYVEASEALTKELEKVSRLLARWFRSKKKPGKDTTPTALIHPSADNHKQEPQGHARPRQLASGYG